MATMTRHNSSRSHAQTHREGKVAKMIEQETKYIPSDWFLWAALGSVAASWGLRAMDREKDGNFVASWAPTLLIFGLYNKLVKIHGSDPD